MTAVHKETTAEELGAAVEQMIRNIGKMGGSVVAFEWRTSRGIVLWDRTWEDGTHESVIHWWWRDGTLTSGEYMPGVSHEVAWQKYREVIY